MLIFKDEIIINSPKGKKESFDYELLWVGAHADIKESCAMEKAQRIWNIAEILKEIFHFLPFGGKKKQKEKNDNN